MTTQNVYKFKKRHNLPKDTDEDVLKLLVGEHKNVLTVYNQLAQFKIIKSACMNAGIRFDDLMIYLH